MSADLDRLRALLPQDGEPTPIFARAELSPTEILALAGRSLTVTSGVLDGVAHDFDRAKPAIRGGALFGKLMVGVARVLTPGGVEGTIFRHWASVALLVDAMLFLLSIVVPSGLRLALVATGYTMAAVVVVEAARYVTQRSQGLAARAKVAAVALAVLFVASFWIGGRLETAFAPPPPLPPSAAPPSFWDRLAGFGVESAFALGVAVLAFLGLVWSRVVANDRANRASPGRQILLASAPFAAMVIGGLLLAAAVRGSAGDWMPWAKFAAFVFVSGAVFVGFVASEGTTKPTL